MSYTLGDNIRNLTPYEPITGEYQIRLDANESFLSLPDGMLDRALLDVIGQGVNRYPDPFATELCQAFAQFYQIDSRYVTAGNGSDELISLIAGAFFSPEDELVTLAQDFSMYRFYGSVYGIKTSIFPKNKDLTIDTDTLIEYINRSGAKGLIFSNPCNPTSLCMSRKEVLRLVQSVPDCLVIVDEAYMDFADASVLDQAHLYENMLVLRTCSKAVGLAAIRLGFAVANDTLTRALRSVKSPYNVNAVTQCIGRRVLAEDGYLVDCIEKIMRSRDQLYGDIMRLYAKHHLIDTVYQTSTNFVYFRTRYAKPIFERLLARSIAVRFMGDYLRITAGTEKENDAVLVALEEIFTDLE